MQKVWKVKEQDYKGQESLSRALGISPVLAQVLLNRGVSTPDEAKDFLSAGNNGRQHEPGLMADMDRAVERIKHAIKHKEQIVI